MSRRARRAFLFGLSLPLAMAASGACGGEADAPPPTSTPPALDAALPLPTDSAAADAAPAESAPPDSAPGRPDASDAPVGDAPPPDPGCTRGSPDGGDASAGDCLARLDLGPGSLPYYRTHALDRTHAAVERLVLVQHGNSRNPWDYFDTMAGLAASLDPGRTAVLAPHFQILGDSPPAGDLYWYNDDWKAGLAARNGPVESYAALDALLSLAKGAFPALERVTIVGFSAGGQTIQRYLAGNTEHDRTPGIVTRYVVGSPGSYMYLDGRRLKPSVPCPDLAGCAVDATSFEVPAYAPGCESADPLTLGGGGGYDAYKFGFEGRAGYLARVSDVDLRARYVSRSVVYLLGEGDANASSGTAYSALDRECPAMVQGPLGASFRLQRGLVFHRYVTQLFGAAHRLMVIPACKHDEACVFSAPDAKLEIFGP